VYCFQQQYLLFKGAVKVSLHGTSMPNQWREYCLTPVTSLSIRPPLLKNAEPTAEITHGMWPTTAPSCNIATA